MKAQLRRRYETAVRVRDFLQAHPTEGVPEQTALARLDELLQRAAVLIKQQEAGVVALHASTEHRTKVRRAVQTKLLRYLSAVGRVAAKDNSELAAQFRVPRTRGANVAFLTIARGMLERATAQKALLVGQGMSEHLLDDLAAGITEFEQTLEATSAGRREHVGASADLESVFPEISEQVRLLDGLVRYRFGDNKELMGAWASARSVFGPPKPHPEPQPGGEAPGAVKAA